MVKFDIPKVAYETWAIYCYNYDENGKTHVDHEREYEIARSLQQYTYSDSHEHILYPKGG